jgi:NAD(P)-dependent dehydrogenase (short-subunit alcohol dehydrogenase family)
MIPAMTTDLNYRGRRVVVTGGASGVGAALLDVLAELEATHVTVLDRNVPTGPHHEYLQVDLADEAALRDAIGKIEAPVHALFNNAGVADDTVAGVTVMAVNYLAVRALSEGLLDSMPEGAAIVNTASLAGHGWPEQLVQITELLDLFDGADGWAKSLAWWEANAATLGRPYNFSKAAVQVYTMRASYPMHRRKVRINSVCPGVVDTPLLEDFRRVSSDAVIDWAIGEMGAAITPRGIASALALLGLPALSYVTGVNLEVDAGITAARVIGQIAPPGTS